jgi:small subunit ribosomal protein S10
MSATKIRVKATSFDHKVLETAVKKLIQVVVRSGGKIVGPVPLKTKKRRVVLRRATFVYSKHADKIESREHKRLIDIYDVNPQVVNNLSTLTLSAGVDILIETIPLSKTVKIEGKNNISKTNKTLK